MTSILWMWSLLIPLAAAADDWDPAWRGDLASFDTTCGCGALRTDDDRHERAPENACSGSGTEPVVFKTNINRPTAYLEEKAADACAYKLDRIKDCSRYYCLPNAQEVKLALGRDFNPDLFATKLDDPKVFHVQQRDSDFVFEGKIDGQGRLFMDVTTMTYEDTGEKDRYGFPVRKRVDRALPTARAGRLMPLMFQYFDVRGNPVTTKAGDLMEDNYYSFMRLRIDVRAENGPISDELVMAAWIAQGDAGAKHFVDHRKRRFTDVVSVTVHEAENRIEYEVNLQ